MGGVFCQAIFLRACFEDQQTKGSPTLAIGKTPLSEARADIGFIHRIKREVTEDSVARGRTCQPGLLVMVDRDYVLLRGEYHEQGPNNQVEGRGAP